MTKINITLFNAITNKDKSVVVEKLITHSTPGQDYYLMVVLAVAMATLGLLLDNVSIIIGSMLISPMLYAFLSLSLGLSISDTKLMTRSFVSIVKAVLLGIAVSVLFTFFMASNSATSEIIARAIPSLTYGVVAFIAGFTAAFTMTRPQLNETLPGIAIAVALVPPIAVAGIGLATFQWSVFRGSISLFILNAIAILAGSIIVFLLMNIYAKKSLATQTLKEEDKKIEKDKNHTPTIKNKSK